MSRQILNIESIITGPDAEPASGHHGKLLLPFHAASIQPAIRIHKDGLVRGTYKAHGIAPSRIFIGVDPLSYPLNSRLEIEFILENSRESGGYRLSATVTHRSLQGIELKLQPGQVD